MNNTLKINRGEKAFTLHKNIEENEKKRRLLLVDNISLLTEMLDNKYYKDFLGNEQSEWVEYLAQLEVFYSRNQIHTYTKIYKKLTQELGVDASKWLYTPITRLSECLSILTKDNYEEWLSKANVLISKDWQIELKEAKGQITEDDKHECNMVQYEVCKICGVKHKI